MEYFLDTSALLKRYIPENGTDFIDRITGMGPVYISGLTLTEAVSVFRRLSEVKAIITEQDFQDLKIRLFADISTEIVEVVPVTTQEIITSTELLSQRYLTPVDALILATAINLKERIEDLCFICADVKLCKIAGDYLTVMNPVDN